jgi:hypothetical protein
MVNIYPGGQVGQGGVLRHEGSSLMDLITRVFSSPGGVAGAESRRQKMGIDTH